MENITIETIHNLPDDELDGIYSIIRDEMSKRNLSEYDRKLTDLIKLVKEIIRMADKDDYWVSLDSDAGIVCQSLTLAKDWGDFSVHLYNGDDEIMQRW